MDLAGWRHDLDFLREQMPKTHGNLFHSMSRERFAASVEQLRRRLPKLTTNQVKAEIMRLVAQVNDGHTRLRQETLGNHMLPVRLHYFADGLFVEAGEKSFANLVGGKVVRIGAMSADAAYAAVRPLIPVDHENDLRRRLLAAELLVTPEVLQAIGASASDETVEVVVQKDERMTHDEMAAGPFRKWENHGWPIDPKGWVNSRSSKAKTLPLWLQHAHTNYWDTFLVRENTVYVQFNEVHDAPGDEPISTYFPRIFQESERRDVQRIVLDLRLNGGGNNQLIRPVWHALLRCERLNRKGRLWVLIGPKTFSAAVTLVGELEQNTNALFAGEPTGEPPNQWGDPVDLTLPNAGLVVQVSTLWWQIQDPRDHREYCVPDLSVPLRSTDYFRNIDAVMDALNNPSTPTGQLAS
jgi:hypothetical protein